MRIDKIELRNLGPLEGEHLIDFTREPLSSATLFAITGQTGTGKTTLLDAICLGLYGKTLQHNYSSPINTLDVHNILHRGQSEAYSRITFSLSDGTSYEVSWSAHLKQAGTFDPPKQTLRKLYPRHEDYDYSEDKISTLIHLSFEQFTHTIILPQNSFAHFLQATQDDKVLLLESLTDTKEFGRISEIIFYKAEQANKNYEELVKKLEGINMSKLDDGTLTKLNEELTLYRGQLTRDETALQGIEKQLQWYADYNKAQQDFETQKKLQFDAQRTCNSLFDKQQLLDRFDSVLPFQALYHEIRQTELEISRLKDQATLKQKDLHEQNELLEKVTHQFEVAQGRLTEVKDISEHRLAQFNLGSSLQGQISAIDTQLKKNNEKLDHYREAIRTQNEELVNKESAHDALSRQIDLIRQRMQAISMHHTLIENMDSVNVQLQKIASIETSAFNLQKTLQDDQKALQSFKDQKNKQNKQRSELQSELHSLKDELLIHDQANHGLNSVHLQQRLSRLSDLRRRSRGALNLWKRIADDYNQIDEKEAEIRRREISLGSLKEDITALSLKLSSHYESRNVLRASHMLSQSDNIKELRRQLKEGNACPVCGAAHHPYHSETEQELGHLLSDLEKNYQLAEHEVIASREQLAHKREQYAEEQGQLQIVRDYFEKTKAQLLNDIQEWTDFQDMDESFNDCSPTVNRQGRQILITQLLDSTERELKQQIEINQQFNQHQESINSINQKIRNNAEALQENFRNLSEVQAEERVLESRITEKQGQLEQYDHDRTYLMNEVDKRMTVSLWKEKWAKSHDNFFQELSSLCEEWKTSTTSLAQAHEQEFKLQEEINALFNWLTDKNNVRTEIEQDVHDMQQLTTNMQQQLHRMFGDQTLDQAIQSQQTELFTATHDAEASHKQLDDITKTVQLLQGQLQDINQQRQRRETDLQQSRSQLDMQISRFNNDHSTLQYFELDKLFTDQRDWMKLRNTIAESNDHLREINFKVETTSARILQLQQATERPSEEPNEMQQALESRRFSFQQHLEKIRQQSSLAQTRLAMHNLAQQQLEGYESQKLQLSQEAQKWAKLSQLIGSADGMKFRKMAQHTIFDILTTHANNHLQKLDPRYQLQVHPGTLDFEIIDHDMLSQPRNIQTLNNAEKAIISLSLAIGLSSFLSGSTHIATFFIDQDFGSLNNTQLNLVLSSLHRFATLTNCKIGILSGAEQIMSCMEPQIRLTKLPANKTHIDIL